MAFVRPVYQGVLIRGVPLYRLMYSSWTSHESLLCNFLTTFRPSCVGRTTTITEKQQRKNSTVLVNQLYYIDSLFFRFSWH